MSASKRFAVVCTEKRGVFAGMIEDSKADPMAIEDMQMCVYWSEDTHGVAGLAAKGPTGNCRISDPMPSGEVKGITAVFFATEEAAAAWRSCPWD